MASWQWAVLQTYGRCVSVVVSVVVCRRWPVGSGLYCSTAAASALSSALSSVVDGQLAAGRTADVRPLRQPVVSVVVCRRWPVGSGLYCSTAAASALSSALSSVVDGQLAAGRTADVRPLCQPVVSIVVCRRWPVGSGPYCRHTYCRRTAAGRCQPVVSVVVCRRWPVGSGPYCRRTAAASALSSALSSVVDGQLAVGCTAVRPLRQRCRQRCRLS